MLCYDLMEMIGKAVKTKKEEDARDYWCELRPKSLKDMRERGYGNIDSWNNLPKWEIPVIEITCHKRSVVDMLKWVGEDDIEEDRLDVWLNLLGGEIREWKDENHAVGWQDDDEVWGWSARTPAFLKWAYYQRQER